jgi:hypothetical protein
LTVFGHTQRNGILQLILILADDSHALIPAAWTSLQTRYDSTKQPVPASETIASCYDLMQAQVVVDSLLRRMDSTKTAIQTHKENNDHGTNDLVGTRSGNQIACQSGLETTRHNYQKGGSNKVVIIDGQGCKPNSRPKIKRTGGQS